MHPNINHKNESIRWARNLLSATDEWIILDTETTGLGDNDVVIQIGIIDPKENVLLDTLLKPTKRKRISREATNRHGITMRMLASAPSLADILDNLIEICRKKKIIIYNAQYDTKLLTLTAYQDDIQIPEGQWVMNCECAMYHYSRFVGKWSDYYQDYVYQKLPNMEHNAVGDCRATLRLIETMANTEITRKWWEFWKLDCLP